MSEAAAAVTEAVAVPGTSSGEEAAEEKSPHTGDPATRMRKEMERVIALVDKKEAEALGGSSSYNWEFLGIRAENEDMRELPEFAATAGEAEHNLCRNRYRDILPYDYSRVKLGPVEGFPEQHDYINASFVNGASGRVSYIAAQGPVPDSLQDFWRCVVQHSVQLIIMVCNVDEYGKRKCERYWPAATDQPLCLGDTGIRIEQMKETEDLGQDLYQRFFRISMPSAEQKEGGGKGERTERIVRQLHYTKWPDHGAPATADPILHLLGAMREAQPYDRTPILVHCSAGVGRTGTVIALDLVRSLLHSGRLAHTTLSLANIVMELRRQRPAMVQTAEQYVLLHRCVARLFRQQLALLDDHHYHNLPLTGVTKPADASASESKEAQEAGGTPNGVRGLGSAETPASAIVVGGVRIPDYPNWPEEKPKGPDAHGPSPTASPVPAPDLPGPADSAPEEAKESAEPTGPQDAAPPSPRPTPSPTEASNGH